VVQGVSFTEADVERRERVALLGHTLVDKLFGDEDPIGAPIRVGTLPFTVVGVVKARGTSTTGQDQDDTIFIPYTVAQVSLKGNARLVDDIMCSAASASAIKPAQDRIAELLRIRHRIADGQPDDFNIRAPEDSIKLQQDTASTLEVMLAAVASVSLVVGGVGIMNIMLVSVAERTCEIGLRMAISAREGDVRRQFLTEALVLGLAGGAFGVVIGLVSSRLFAENYGWPMVISANTIAIAVAFSSAVGVIFGYYPARHASSLDPIEALRSE